MSIIDFKAVDNIEKSYLFFLSELRNDSLEDDDTELLSEDFVEEFKKIIVQDTLNQFTPKKFYWLNLIDKLVDTLDITESFLTGELVIEDAISYLETSEYLKYFIDNSDMPDIALKNIIEMQELQIISFFWLQINQDQDWRPGGPVSYTPIYEFGENTDSLHLSDNFKTYTVPHNLVQGTFPVISYCPGQQTLNIDLEDEEAEVYCGDTHFLEFKNNNKKILVLNNINSSHKSKIEKAFHTLKNLAPGLYDFLFHHTQVIIPIKEEGVVSYSMDTLPAYSCINIFDRDFVDLVDDLIHENGHHYLNAILEGEAELIIEDNEQVFYSPWRKALRPIRGLYHAVCTFYWAFDLFSQIASHSDLNQFFNEKEIIKIHQRVAEEYIMIMACENQVDIGKTLGKITPEGHELALKFIQKVKKSELLYRNSLSFLETHAPESHKMVIDLEINNKASLEKYQLI